MIRLYHLLGLVCVILFISCQSNFEYSESHTIPNGIWEFDERIEYSIDAQDTTTKYSLIVDLDFDKDFSYQNFYTKIITLFPSKKSAEDVVSFQLGDGKGGWEANCRGKNCSYELLLSNNFRFKEVGVHKILFENFSRKELVGIKEIGLKLIVSEQI